MNNYEAAKRNLELATGQQGDTLLATICAAQVQATLALVEAINAQTERLARDYSNLGPLA